MLQLAIITLFPIACLFIFLLDRENLMAYVHLISPIILKISTSGFTKEIAVALITHMVEAMWNVFWKAFRSSQHDSKNVFNMEYAEGLAAEITANCIASIERGENKSVVLAFAVWELLKACIYAPAGSWKSLLCSFFKKLPLW